MATTRRSAGLVIAGCLGASALALAVAPLFVPSEYSWASHTTSQSAAQGVPGAWVARLGFVLLGVGVLWLAVGRRSVWGRWPTAFHAGFGVAMVATAAFSTRPWVATAPYDPLEDLLHSVAATLVGFCFALGVLALVVGRRRERRELRRFDLLAIAATVVLPLSMAALPGYAGVLQRAMFVVAYAWYLRAVHRYWTGEDAASLGQRG